MSVGQQRNESQVAIGRKQHGVAWTGCGPAQSPPRCIKCNCPPINGQCTDFISFDVALYLYSCMHCKLFSKIRHFIFVGTHTHRQCCHLCMISDTVNYSRRSAVLGASSTGVCHIMTTVEERRWNISVERGCSTTINR